MGVFVYENVRGLAELSVPVIQAGRALEETYGHLAPDADDYELGLLDAFDARISDAAT